MDENEMMNRMLIRSLDELVNSPNKEKISEDMLRMLDRFNFGQTFGPVFYGLRLAGASDDEIIGVMDSVTGLICHAKKDLEKNAYEYKIKEDE